MTSANDNTRGLPSEHDQGGQAGKDVLAIALAEMARELQNQSPQELLMAIAESAAAVIPGAEHGSISLVEGHRTVTAKAPTGELPTRVDEIQTAEGQGRYLDAVYEQKTVRIPDMRNESRWPHFARRAVAETPIRSMLALQLFVEAENLGALNIFSSHPQAFSDESEQSDSSSQRTRQLPRWFSGSLPAPLGSLLTRYDRRRQGHPHGTLQDRRTPGVPASGQGEQQNEHQAP